MNGMRERRRAGVVLGVALVFGVAIGCKGSPPSENTKSSASPSEPSARPATAAGEPAAAARAIEQSCNSICERSRKLNCARPQDCMPNCLAMAIGSPCADEFTAFYRCLVQEPVEHWECAEEGVAAIREGFCEKEQERAVGCVEAKAR
jgi:hypothetical protein